MDPLAVLAYGAEQAPPIVRTRYIFSNITQKSYTVINNCTWSQLFIWTQVGAVVQLVEYRTRNQEVAGSTHTRSTASNLEQVANLLSLCAQANSASYPQQDGK